MLEEEKWICWVSQEKGFTHMLRAWRDVVGTIVMGLIFSYVFKINAVKAVGALFLLGIVLHRAFNVRTTVDKLLFP